MKTLPKSIAIIGAAATGCQLASVFQDFGSKVSLLDAAPRILPAEDEDVSDAVCQAFYDQGINVEIGIGFDTRIEKKNNSYILSYSKDGEPKQLEVGAIILAVGWQGNIDGLDLEKAAVQHQKSYILVDDYLQTTAPNIYAAGDITGRMMLVQSGQYEARIAAENALLDTPTKFEHQIVPHGGFTDPEYASVGRSQSQISPTTNTITATIPYSSLDRAVIDGHTAGFCKLIVDTDTNQILGAHVVGEQANEIVHVIAAGMAANMRIEQLAHLEIAYPTFTGIIGLAARQIVNQLGQTPLTLEWRTLAPNTAEWERSANFG
jgi:pyruvate/2-oxoglutarate dehydrogenase complex dihydrolipoamide dehydrogenase (E3) component